MTDHSALEARLIVRARTGADPESFGSLVKMHQAKVRGFLRRLARNEAAADDLAQETFLLAYQKLATYRGEGGFSGWLCSIAYRLFLQSQRRSHREQEINELYGSDTIPEAYEDTSADQLSLERALLHLESKEVAALTLCFTLGLSHSEAAAVMALPLGTLKSHVDRGKKKLHAVLCTEPLEDAS